jgi:DNA-binding SARP family transcriptional activator
LRVRTLGGFAVWCGVTPIPAAAWSQSKQTLLFKCLLSAPDQTLPRQEAIALLWPHHDPA